MKKILFVTMSLLLCVATLLTGCSKNSSVHNNNISEKTIEEIFENSKKAKVSVWDGTIADSFSKGDGSQVDPYIIGSAAELAYVSKLCAEGHNFSGEFLKLKCNINLSGLDWDPIGKYSPRNSYGARPTNTPEFKDFQGNFDGNGYFISNYVIYKSIDEDDGVENYGLFGSVRTATIENLIVKNFKIMVRGYNFSVGGLVGESVDTCYFRNCHAINGSVSAYVIGGNVSSGGLIGTVNNDSSENEGKCATYTLDCSANTNISLSCLIDQKSFYISSEDDDKHYTNTIAYNVGGLIGNHRGTLSTTLNCFSAGNIYVSTANTEEEENALGKFSYIGGLMAYTNSTAVKNCYSSVNITSEKDVRLEGFGGLFGMVERATISNCYSSGDLKIKSTEYNLPCGGLIGKSDCTVENCFVVGNYTWSNENKNSNFLIGKSWTPGEYFIDNCYVSSSCKIKEAAPTSDPDRYDTRDYAVVDKSRFTNKDFVLSKLGFEEKPANVTFGPNNIQDYPGWVIIDGELPKMYYEETIEEKPYEVKKNIASFVGKKAKDAITEFGEDYTMSGASLCFPNTQISFTLGNYSGTLLGTEKIVAVNIGDERDLGNGLSSSMTFIDLKEAVKQDIPVPSYLEIDGTYTTSVDRGNYTYIYTWSTENYDTEKCDYVSIIKRT